MRAWGAHGEFCARHQWEVIVGTLALLACAASLERAPLPHRDTCAGWARHCPGLEAQYQAADAALMTALRCAALLYAYWRIADLRRLARRHLLLVAGLVSSLASFAFTTALAGLLTSEPAAARDAPFLFLLVVDLARGAKLAEAGGGGGRRLGRALAALGPPAALDTLLAALLVGVGALSGVPRLERACSFACLALLVDYAVFVTFYPACLSLVAEFAAGRAKQPTASPSSIDDPELPQPNPVVRRVKMIMAAGLLCVHLSSRLPGSTEENGAPHELASAAEEDAPLHPYVRRFSVSPDGVVMTILLGALIVNFAFFEDGSPDADEITKRDDIEPRPIIEIEVRRDADVGTQTEVLDGDFKLWPEIAPSAAAATIGAARRSVAECLELWRAAGGGAGGLAALTDDEVSVLAERAHVPLHGLEVALGDETRGVRLRRRVLASRFPAARALERLPYLGYDYSKVLNACCENVVGYVGVPLGYAGPLVVDGVAYLMPLATTEGALVASVNRGAKAIGVRGITAVVEDVGMTRAPVVRFPNVVRAHECRCWLDGSGFGPVKAAFDSTSRFARLIEIHVGVDGPSLYLRFRATTGDAMGMNMVSKGAENALRYVSSVFPDMEVVSLSGNYCADKKAAAINWIKGRGKRVVCEATVPAASLRTVFRTEARALARCNRLKNLTGSALAGAIGGNNAHAANIVTAMFIATGQDPAQNVTSGACMTSMETCGAGGEDLYVTVTMPSLEVGTVGGGTGLAAQAACLELLGVRGPGSRPAEHSTRLAGLVCATVLAGELSLMAALVNSDLVKSHMRHNRSAVNVSTVTSSPDS